MSLSTYDCSSVTEWHNPVGSCPVLCALEIGCSECGFFLGTFMILRKVNSSFIMSVWNLVFEYFSKSIKKIHFWLKSDSNRFFIWRPLHIMIISVWILHRIRNVSDKIGRGNQNRYCMVNNFFSEFIYLFFTFHRSKLSCNNCKDIEIVILLNISNIK